MFFHGFFLRNSVNNLIYIFLSHLKDQKPPVSAIETPIDDNGLTILLAIGQSGRCYCQTLIPVKLFQNLTSGFGEEDFLKNFSMSV